MFESMTYDTIMERMLSLVPDTIDKREGSVIWDALSPAASELELNYIAMDYIMRQAWNDTADREYLIRRCKEKSIFPIPASKAVIQGTFTPADIDLQGVRFSLETLNYVATEKIDGNNWMLECETPGTVGNQYSGTLIPIEYVDGLESATVDTLLIPGEDEEDTESIRERYFESFQNYGFGGNVRDYFDKTNAIDGVGGTRVTPIWHGPGTVKLTILDGEYNKASSALIDKVQNEIDPYRDGNGLGLAPIGHIVTVDTPNEAVIDISMSLEFDTDYSWDNLAEEITSVLANYLLEIRMDWGKIENRYNPTVIRIAQIETRILGIEGVVDISGTQINGVEVNYTITNNDIPVLGDVNNA